LDTVDTDVFVVGAGPAGLTASALLARDGVNAITITKYPATAHIPRAHITNQRTMEVMRDLGIEDRVRQVAVAAEAMRENVWATSVAGRELARMTAWGTGADRKGDYEAASPCAMCNIGQHELEPAIMEGALGFGADVRFDTELVEISQDGDRVHAVVRRRTTGQTYAVCAQYAIGADGARSTVAHQLGFEHDGQASFGHAVGVWFEADLTRYRAHRPGSLFFVIKPGRDLFTGPGVITTIKPWTEFVANVAYDPAVEQLDLSESAMVNRVRDLIGDPAVAIKVKSISPWQANHLNARQYRKGRVFLAGDAAHRHSPSNGLGSNTSVQDSYNLAWKLALVVHRKASDPLLDTYHAERQPVGRQVVERALASITASSQIPLAFAPENPNGQRSDDVLAEFVSDTPGGRARRQRLSEVLAENQKYQFNAHGVELGQRYHSTAAVTDGATPPPYARDPDLYYEPTTFPGAYLPHAWVLHGGRPVSTLDAAGGGRFVVITGIGGDAWLRAADKLAAELRVDLAGRQIGPGLEYDDIYRDWARLREVDDRGCVLVRPDRYIAWRAMDRFEDPEAALRRALTQILAPDGTSGLRPRRTRPTITPHVVSPAD
jgi:2,4-dichlorophenol 6-monooxygenase